VNRGGVEAGSLVRHQALRSSNPRLAKVPAELVVKETVQLVAAGVLMLVLMNLPGHREPAG